MNDQNPNASSQAAAPKSRSFNPFSKNGNPTISKSKLVSAKEKAKTAAAIVGVATIALVVVSSVAKRNGVTGATVSLPDVDVTPTTV